MFKHAEKHHGAVALATCGLAACLALAGCTSAGKALGKATLGKDDGGTVIATYVYDGKKNDVTADDVWGYLGSKDSYKESDDSYRVPSPETTLGYIRTQVMSAKADKEGITVSDDDVDQQLKSMTGGNMSMDDAASEIGMDKDALKGQIEQSAKIYKLQEQVANPDGEKEPDAPAAPDDGSYDAASKDYADYIVGLAGDEWDASANDGKGGWKDASSTYASALASYDISNDSASYGAAEAAYQVAYGQWDAAHGSQNEDWSKMVSDEMSNCAVAFYSISY